MQPLCSSRYLTLSAAAGLTNVHCPVGKVLRATWRIEWGETYDVVGGEECVINNDNNVFVVCLDDLHDCLNVGNAQERVRASFEPHELSRVKIGLSQKNSFAPDFSEGTLFQFYLTGFIWGFQFCSRVQPGKAITIWRGYFNKTVGAWRRLVAQNSVIKIKPLK